MKLSIIIGVFNRYSHLKYLLWNLFNYQNFPKDEFEVIVVDDGSDQDILGALKKDYPNENIIYFRTNWKTRIGFPNIASQRSTPVNAGVSLSSGQIILISDADLYPLESNHLSEFALKLTREKEIMSAIFVKVATKEHGQILEKNYKNPELLCQKTFEWYPNEYYPQTPSDNGGAFCDMPLTRYIDRHVHTVYRHAGYWAQLKQGFVNIGGFNEEGWCFVGGDTELSYRFDALGFQYIPSKLHILHNWHHFEYINPNSDYCDVQVANLPESIVKETDRIRNRWREEMINKTYPLIYPFSPKISDDDILVKFK